MIVELTLKREFCAKTVSRNSLDIFVDPVDAEAPQQIEHSHVEDMVEKKQNHVFNYY